MAQENFEPVRKPPADRPDSIDEPEQRVRHRLELEFGSREESPEMSWSARSRAG